MSQPGKSVAETIVNKRLFEKFKKLESKEGLTRQSLKFVNERKEQRVYHVYTDKDGNMFSTPGMMTIISEFFGAAHVEQEYTKLAYKSVDAIMIPNNDIMAHLINSVTKNAELSLMETGTASRLNIANLFALVSVLPGMKEVYADYLLDHDDDISITAQLKEASPPPIQIHKVDDKSAVHTKSFMLISAAVAIYLLVKTFDKDHSNHVNDYLDKRVKALAFQLGPAAAGTDAKAVRTFLKGDLSLLSSVMGHYPKIKQAIFPRIVYGRSLMLTHIKDILRGSQLTLMTMIADFLRAEEPTRLHVHPPVIQEIRSFLIEWVQITQKYGDDWPFFKLIDPQGVATSSRKYIKIGAAAFAWHLVTTGQESLERLKSVGKNETYMELARAKLPKGLLASGTFDIAAFLREMHAEGFLTAIKQQVKWSEEGELVPEEDED